MEQYDLVILGGGPAGYRAAELASAGGMKTALFETDKLGGTCLNEGCIPTKVMLNSSKLLYYAKNGAAYGILADGADKRASGPAAETGFSVSHAAVLARKEKVVRALVAGVRTKLKMSGAGVFYGSAEISGKKDEGFIVTQTSGDESGRKVETARVLVATGSAAVVPRAEGADKGLDSGFIITSREALTLAEVPKRLVIVGGGVIGLELADYYNAAGSCVTVVELLERAAYPMDPDIAGIVTANLRKRGVEFHFGSLFQGVCNPGGNIVNAGNENDGCGAIVVRIPDKNRGGEDGPYTDTILSADKTLISVGRRPRAAGTGAEELGVYIDKGAIATDGFLRTNIPGIYAAGDVNGKSMLAHTAYLEAERAVSHMLGKPSKMRYGAIPSVIYTNPEAAGVGETEESATVKGMDVKTVKVPLQYSGRYVAETAGGDGMCKVLFDARKKTVAGVHMAGPYVSEIILSAAFIVESQWPVSALREIAFPHPTVGEALREALFTKL